MYFTHIKITHNIERYTEFIAHIAYITYVVLFYRNLSKQTNMQVELLWLSKGWGSGVPPLGLHFVPPAPPESSRSPQALRSSLKATSPFDREGNGTPLQYSCLANPIDGGAWKAAVHGVAQSRTRLKRLSSSSSLV